MAKNDTPDQSAEVDQAVTGTIVPATIYDGFREYLQDRATQDDALDVGAEVTEKIVSNILLAEDEDGVWSASEGGALQGRDLVGLELRIHAMRVSHSTRDDIETRLGVYITCDATAIAVPNELGQKTGLKPGMDFAMQTGADQIVANVRWHEAKDKMPYDAVVIGKGTRKGNTVLALGRPPVRATPGHVAS